MQGNTKFLAQTEQTGCLITSSEADIYRDISQQRHSSTSPSRWGGSGALPSAAGQYGNTVGRVEVSFYFFFPQISFPICEPEDAPMLQTFSTCFHATEQLFWAQPAHPVFFCDAEMKTICSLQPPSSDLLPEYVLLFFFDLVDFYSHRALHKILNHMLGLEQVVSQKGAEPHCFWRSICLFELRQSCTLTDFTAGIISLWILLVHRCLLWWKWALVSYFLCPIEVSPSETSEEGLILEQSERLHKCKWSKTHLKVQLLMREKLRIWPVAKLQLEVSRC